MIEVQRKMWQIIKSPAELAAPGSAYELKEEYSFFQKKSTLANVQ
jgi:hypothetical protein